MNPKTKKATVAAVVIIVIALVVVLIVVCVKSSQSDDTSSSSSNSYGIELSDMGYTSTKASYGDYWTCTVTGVAENTKKDYSLVSIEFSVYDADGYNIGTAYDNISNFAKGDKWKFEATLYMAKSEPARVTYKGMTAIAI